QIRLKSGSSRATNYLRGHGKTSDRDAIRRRQTAKLTQFVGRQHELQQMSTLWERAKAGKGQVALLCGEPGIGKSRVTKTWLNLIVSRRIEMASECGRNAQQIVSYRDISNRA